jgi:ATP-binding cassette subfamily F protein 2
MAINAFEGGVVLVSHDERLITLVADEIWCVNKGIRGKPGSVYVFDGSFEEYCERLKPLIKGPKRSTTIVKGSR